MTPTVSIVLPTFNRLQFLRTTVNSVFSQTFPDWELLIADDGSGEETLGFLTQLERDPRVRLLRLAHTGNPSAVRNAAVREARGRYIAFLDSDDVWLPAKLQSQLAAHAACAERAWSYSALARIDADGKSMRDGLGLNWTPHEGAIFEPLLTLAAAVAMPTVMVERRLLEETGGFDEQQSYFEDYDLWLRLSLRSEVIVIKEPLAQVRNHDEHYSADRIRVYQARFRLLNKISPCMHTPRLRAALRLERAKTAASLALVAGVAGMRMYALQMLWRSRICALKSDGWWQKAASTLVRVALPRPLQELVRKYRRQRRALAAAS
jgi:glycosyltransferase involved in cell wall biosynthesis